MPESARDLLLVRREQLLRSTAVRRSFRLGAMNRTYFAAFCCGLPLPQRFHMPLPLSREALLRQANGFEGLVGVEVGSNPNPLAVLELGHRAVRRFDLGVACRSAPADDADRDRAVAEVPDLRVVGVKLR